MKDEASGGSITTKYWPRGLSHQGGSGIGVAIAFDTRHVFFTSHGLTGEHICIYAYPTAQPNGKYITFSTHFAPFLLNFLLPWKCP
jgi:hypothetical protein